MAFENAKQMTAQIRKLNARAIFVSVLRDRSVQAQIVDLNTQSQLYEKGIDSKGQSLGEYSNFTKRYKTAIAARLGNDTRTANVTLKDTGEFYSGFKLVPSEEGGFIVADTLKDGTDDLARIYGNDILGLTDESKKEITPEIESRFLDSVRQQIGR